MAISEPMCREFETRYGVPFAAFHNVLDLDAWRAGGRTSWQAGPVVRLVYSGSIEAYAQLESLCDVADAVVTLREQGLPVELRIHAPRHSHAAHRGLLERAPAVVLEPAPEPDAIVPLLAEADVLVLPVNFDRSTVDYVRLSFPTKLPAYLASGSPVLAYGPAEVTQMDLARREGWGHCVARRDPQALREAIRKLATDAALRERLGRRGREVAFAEHDAARVRPRFQDALRRAARGGLA
jgi:glycosyltransferase involved in cell wall biosynthesis